jgi:hypothetical protein
MDMTVETVQQAYDESRQTGQYAGTEPIVGGATSVSLTSATVLQSHGISVAPLGSATIDASGPDPVANFGITGGTESAGGNADVILHQGSGLELSNAESTIDLNDFRIDTANSVVRANVTVDGTAAGNLPVFDLGPGGALKLTEAAANVVSDTFAAPDITSSVTIGLASPMPVIDSAWLHGYGAGANSMQFVNPPDTQPLVGGETSVTLTVAPALQSLNINVSPLGAGMIDVSSADPVAQFPITGGTLGPDAGEAVILHQASGLKLSDLGSSVELGDFLIDTQNHVVDANVSANDLLVGNVAVFDLGQDGTLRLTSDAAGLLDNAFGTSALSAGQSIGFAAPSPIALPNSTWT